MGKTPSSTPHVAPAVKPTPSSTSSDVVVAAASLALCVLLAASSHTRWELAEPSPSKPYASPDAFYPFYLTQHSQAGTKLLHVAGTAVVTVLLARSPRVLAAFCSALAAGLLAFHPLRHLASGAGELVLMVAAYLSVGRVLRCGWADLLPVLLVGYGCAWAGHFFVEHNRPATFVYPSFSLLGDFRMLIDVATGRIPLGPW